MMICLDANCVIYLVEQTPIWGPKISARLAKVIMDGHAIAMSDLTRTECLTGPLKVGDAAILSDYQRFFSHADVNMLPLNTAVCERAAEIRVPPVCRSKFLTRSTLRQQSYTVATSF